MKLKFFPLPPKWKDLLKIKNQTFQQLFYVMILVSHFLILILYMLQSMEEKYKNEDNKSILEEKA